MNIKTLIDYFEVFANNHPILRTFSWGNLSDYSRDTFITQYPAIHIVPLPGSIDKTFTDMSFSVLVYDLLNEDVDTPLQSNQLDSMALTQEILNDFINEFINELTDFGFFLQTPVQYTPFVDRFAESVCGIEATITITAEQTSCIPASVVPQPITPSSISNLYAWYDFQDTDTITLTGGTDIIEVSDKSGNNYDLTPYSASPSYSASTYTNTDGYYAMWDLADNTAMIHNLSLTKNFTDITGFVVYTRPGSDGAREIYGLYTGDTSISTYSPMLNWNIGEGLTIWNNMACREIEGNTSYQETDAMILRQRVFSTTLGDFDGDEYSRYGVLNADPNDCSVDNTFDYANSIILGKNSDVSLLNKPMGIFEVIIYDRALTDEEYDGVLKYLQDKYKYFYWV